VNTVSDKVASHEIECQLVSITNRKLHEGFRLVPTSVTLNDLDRRNSPILCYFTEFDSFGSRLHHSGWRQTYHVRKIIVFQLYLAKAVARSLCDS